MLAGPRVSSSAVLACSRLRKVGVAVLKLSLRPLTNSFTAEAIDQWFETFQNYEVTLVSMFPLSVIFQFIDAVIRKKWLLPLWTSTSRKN